MVSVKSSRGRASPRKLGFVLGALAAPLTLSVACGKLIGVEDTQVMSGGASQGGSGGSSATSGGAATTMTGGVSSTMGGSVATSGGAATSTGGKVASAGSTASGGSVATGQGGDTSSAGADAGDGPGGAATVTGGASSGGTTGGKGGTSAGGASGGKGGASTGGASSGGTAGKGGAGGTTGGAATGGAGGASTTCTPACTLDKPVCEAGTCVNRGPTMVKLGKFWVDSTEVTVAQYKKFLDAKGTNTSGQPAVCSWNTTYYDDSIPMYPDNYPMSYVDWCDATAFCAWSGKHLCGSSNGGPIARADMFTPSLSQWYLACGGPNSGSHPSGSSMCNNSGSIAAVATYKCEGFYPGVFDMEGNVAEWVDSCMANTGKDDVCYLMGGGVFDQKSYCDEVYEPSTSDTGNKRSATAVSFGFRCCSG